VWRLCATCLLNLKSTNTPVKLKDGSTFGGGKQGFSKALAAQLEAQKPKPAKSTLLALAAKPADGTANSNTGKTKSQKRKEAAKRAEARRNGTGREKRAKVARSLVPVEEVLYYP
jgi:hypothetical protein